jgi:hypothetical protein
VNWLAWDTRSYLGAFIGGAVGFLLVGVLLEAGHFSPWIIGLLIGLGCATLTLENSSMRGVVLAVAAAWTMAAAQVWYQPPAGTEGLIAGLIQFHETMTLGHLGLFLAGMFAAYWLGRRSLRRGASRRVAGA